MEVLLSAGPTPSSLYNIHIDTHKYVHTQRPMLVCLCPYKCVDQLKGGHIDDTNKMPDNNNSGNMIARRGGHC